MTRTDLEMLTQRTHDGTCISMFIPTHRFGSGITADRLRWRKLLLTVEATLAQAGTNATQIAHLLAPAHALRDDALSWQYMSDGLALFDSLDWHRTFRLPIELPALATIGNRFIVSPLRAATIGGDHFLLLALSQRRIRLFEGSRAHIEEVELDDMPANLHEIAAVAPVRSHTMTRLTSSGTGGRAGRAVFYGHGGGSDYDKKEDARAFLRRVDDGLREYLGDQMLPMVLVGLESLTSTYREVSSYPNVIAEEERRNPDQLSADELHAAAWPIVRASLGVRERADIERFDQLHGTGLASVNVHDVSAAAREGRVEALLLAAQPWASKAPTDEPPVVRLGTDPAYSTAESIDRAATETVAAGGRLHVLARSRMPGHGDVAALFRY